MLRFFFKGKRKIKHHDLVIEASIGEYRKNLFLKRYIILLILALMFLFWINGNIVKQQYWTYYFSLNNDNKFVTLNSDSIPQPFNKSDIIEYTNNVVYSLFSLTPPTYQQKFNQLFSRSFLNTQAINGAYNALKSSLMIDRLKNGWYFSVKSLEDPVVKMGQFNFENKSIQAWKITYKNFVLYARKKDDFSLTKSKLSIFLIKAPFIVNPKRLAIVRIFRSDVKDIGNRNGY